MVLGTRMPSSQHIILRMRTAISTGHSPISFPEFTLPLSSDRNGANPGNEIGHSHGCVVDRGKSCSVDRGLEVAGSSPGVGRTNTQVLKISEK